jgi:hypothetical protein
MASISPKLSLSPSRDIAFNKLSRLLKISPRIFGFVIHSICGFGVICDARTG